MRSQLESFIHWLSVVVYSLLSNPKHVAQIVFLIVICVALLAVAVPSLTAMAGGLAPGGGH